jgi:hypothetical protein
VIDAVLRFCLRERLIVLLAAVGIAAYGWYAMQTVPLDAIPDVGENQVIIHTEWPGRSPKDMEDQVTYPLSVAFQAVPGAKSVRGRSMFGFSFVQVTFADSVDFYWARSRVAEQLSTVSGMLPDGVVPQLAPDATALGQVLLYVLEPDGSTDLAELRSRQDFFIRYALESVEGVAEVASIGGYVREYQVDVDPDELRYHAIPLSAVISAVRESSIDVGAKTVESGGMEFIVRGRGFIGSDRTSVETRQQIEQTVIATRDGIPLRVRDVATVQEGPAFRRGALDLNGHEAVGGVVIMRYGANPRDVIQRVQEKIASLEPELDGLRIVPIYDRTGLIDETIHTLSEALAEETAITIVVVVLFLLHVQSSLVIAVTLPLAVLMAFAAMKLFGVDANIMSLAGIAIAIGTMVDMGIIVLENVYDGLAELERHPAAKEGRDDGGDHDRCQFFAGVFSYRPRCQALHPAGLDENLCPGSEPDRSSDRRAGTCPHLLANPLKISAERSSRCQPCWARRGTAGGCCLGRLAHNPRLATNHRGRVGRGSRQSARLATCTRKAHPDGCQPGQPPDSLALRRPATDRAKTQSGHAFFASDDLRAGLRCLDRSANGAEACGMAGKTVWCRTQRLARLRRCQAHLHWPAER